MEISNKLIKLHKKLFKRYVNKIYNESLYYVPINRYMLIKSGRLFFHNPTKASLTYKMPYAQYQYETLLMHTPGRSIGKAYSGARTYRLKMLEKKAAKIKSDDKRYRAYRNIVKVRQSVDFDYGVGYRALTGKAPKWARKSKYGRKLLETKKYKAEWVKKAIEEVGTYIEFVRKVK